MSQVTGKVSQIIGPVVDVTFSGEDNALPKIYAVSYTHLTLPTICSV